MYGHSILEYCYYYLHTAITIYILLCTLYHTLYEHTLYWSTTAKLIRPGYKYIHKYYVILDSYQ